jgi:hypothetical protein
MRVFIAVGLLFVGSAGLRLRAYDARQNVSNIDAPYHVLLTVEAMRETPAAVHHFLPIVTLGRSFDKGIPLGSAVPDARGNYYYASFPPLGFVAPYVFFQATRLELTPRNLMVFNLGLHLAATVLLCLIAAECLAILGTSGPIAELILVLTAATYLFTFEAMSAHGLVYWHHSLFQVVWLAQLYAFLLVARRLFDGQTPTRAERWTLIVASFLAPSVEWAGYLSGGVAALLLATWPASAGRNAARALAMGVCAATLGAGLVYVLQFASVVDPSLLLMALHGRAAARAALSPQLGRGYLESFGLILPLASVIVIGLATWRGRPRLAAALVTTAAVALVPLTENAVLMEHAARYHFDRLKALVPLTLAIAGGVALMPKRARWATLAAWAGAIVWNVGHVPRARTAAALPVAATERLMTKVRVAARPCAVYGVEETTRGWAVLTLHANAYEDAHDIESLRQRADAHHPCQVILLQGPHLPNAMYAWSGAIVYDVASKRTDTLTAY